VTGVSGEDSTAAVQVNHPLLWTPETPDIYDALVELVQDGKVIEARRVTWGLEK